MLWGHTNHIPPVSHTFYAVYVVLFFAQKSVKLWICCFDFHFISSVFVFWIRLIYFLGCWSQFILEYFAEKYRTNVRGKKNFAEWIRMVAFISHVQNNHFTTALIVNCCFFLFSSDVYIIICYGKWQGEMKWIALGT